MTRSALPIVAFVALMIAAGVVQGLNTERWQASAAVAEACRKLDKVPLALGDWRGENFPLEEEDLKRAGIKGHVSYRYENLRTGDKVSLLIVCGRVGPISVHTPDVCYGAAGYSAVGERYAKEVPVADGRTLNVWSLRFRAPSTVSSKQIEVNWVWNNGKNWIAAEVSRLTFAGSPALYKMYVVRDLPALAADRKNDPSKSFLQTFLPELEKILAR
jgi:hypothetical protein